MTYGEHLVSVSSLPSGNSARDHILNMSKPDTIYADGFKKVYVKDYSIVNGRIELLDVSGYVHEQLAKGGIITNSVSGGVVARNINGDIGE